MKSFLDYKVFKIAACDNELQFIFDIQVGGYPHQHQTYATSDIQKIKDFILFLKHINRYFILDNLLLTGDMFQISVRVGSQHQKIFDLPVIISNKEVNLLIDAVTNYFLID